MRSTTSANDVSTLLLSNMRGEGRWAYQVVPQQLHDQRRILVALLTQGVKLGDGIVKGLLGKMASLVGRVEDLIVEDREVQGKSKADGVGGSQVGLCNLGGILVGLKRLVGRGLALVAQCELGQVTVVVTLPARRSNSVSASTHNVRSEDDVAHILW